MGKKKNKQYPRQSRNSNRGESLSFDELRSHFGMEEIIEKKPIQYKIKRKEENELNSHYSYDKNADFINPYNFISLGDGVERKENQKGDLTGYINCELIVKTPLIIPGKIVKEEREHKYYDALVIADKPIIPGNSLRGVIRSQFETLSHSCLSTIDEEMRFTARSQDFFNDAGLLYKDRLVKSKVVYMDFKHFGFSLDEDRCLIKNGKIYKTGEQFYVQLEKNQDVYQGDREYVSYITKNKEENCYEAYLFIGETHPDNYKDKHKYVKLCVVKEHETIICNEVTQLRKDYFTVLQEYRDSKKNIYETHHFYNNLGVDEKSEVIPVWYNQVNDNIYVSPAQRGRYAYKRVIKDLLRVNSESRSYAPCDDENHLCAACSLFGTVQENIAVPSRIRISDAITDENNCIENSYRTLPPLSSPKFSNPEFYLDYIKNRDRKSFNLFNYDFSVFGKEMSPIDSKYLLIRGRKNYWHFMPNGVNYAEKNQLNASYKTIKVDTKFTFKVYFDNITEKELKQLIISLNLEKNNNSKCYKLGHGKPLGYGSCKINVLDVKCRKITVNDKKIQYEIKDFTDFYRTYEEAFGNQERLYYEVRTIMDFNALKDYNVPVCYPIGDGKDKESFRWFILNRECASTGTRAKTTHINQLLPFISDEYDEIVMKGYYSTNQRGKR